MAQQNFLFRVASADSLPGLVCQELKRQTDQAIHGIFVCPPQQYPLLQVGFLRDLPFGWRHTPQRIVLLADRAVLVIYPELGTLKTIQIPFDSLVSIENVTVLLYAYVRFTWVCGDHLETLKIEFNAVGERIVRQQLDCLRTLMLARRSTPAPKLPTVPLPEMPLKYRNYLRSGLLPDERPVKVVYQPAIRLSGQRWIQSYISPNRALAVTDNYLVALEDERRSAEPDYAVVTKYTPLWQIQSVDLDYGDPISYLKVTTGTPETGETSRYPLNPAAAQDLSEALGAVRRDPPSLVMAYART